MERSFSAGFSAKYKAMRRPAYERDILESSYAANAVAPEFGAARHSANVTTFWSVILLLIK